MAKEEIFQSLCSYDKRNPYNTIDEWISSREEGEEKDKIRCYCDNCFYGKTELAEKLLKFYN